MNKKSSIIMILKVLEEYSDENHYLTHQEIIDKIYEKYAVELERKSIASSIKLLIDLDYDINKNPKGGFALLSRVFDSSEVSFLVDAIFSSKSISGRRSKELSKKVSSCLSIYQRKEYDYLFKSVEVNRTINNDVFYNIELINEAIANKKCISFSYLTYDDNLKPTFKYNGFRYWESSPYYLVNNFGKYYCLLTRKKYQTLSAYRVDQMYNIEIMDNKDSLPLWEVSSDYKDFSITEYINDNIYLFDGDVIESEIILNGSYAISYVKDWFGDNGVIFIDNNTGTNIIKARVKCNENAMYYWIMQYAEHVTLISPEKLVLRLKNTISNLNNKYKQMS